MKPELIKIFHRILIFYIKFNFFLISFRVALNFLSFSQHTINRISNLSQNRGFTRVDFEVRQTGCPTRDRVNLPSSNYYYSRNQTPRCHSRTRRARESGGSRVAHKDAIFRTRVAKKKMVYGFNARLITHLTADPILLSSPLPPLPPPRLSQFSRLSPLPLLLSFVLHANRAKRFFPWKNSSSVFLPSPRLSLLLFFLSF